MNPPIANTALKLGLISLMLISSGCARLGLPMLFEGRGGAISANKSQQERSNEELLLNIVRTRYQDPIEFLPKEPNRWSLFGRGNRAELEEVAELNRGYLDPVEIDTLIKLLEADWEISLVGDLMFDRLGEHENRPAAPSYPDFVRTIQFLQSLQSRGDLSFVQLPASWKIGEAQEAPMVMKLGFDNESEAKEFNQLMQTQGQLLADDDGSIVQLVMFILPSQELAIGSRGAEITFVQLRLRSLAEQFQHFSMALDLPAKHVRQGLVDATAGDESELANQLRITSHWHRKRTPYTAIRYRGFWYHIEDSDVRTKRAFGLLKLIHHSRYTTE